MLTTNPAVLPIDLLTAADAWLELGLPVPETADPRMAKLITRVSRAIINYCGRPFAYADAVETFGTDDQSLSSALVLSMFPVTQIVSVEADTGIGLSNVLNGAAPNLLDPSAYWVDAERGILTLRGYDGGGDPIIPLRRVVVTYSGGYQVPGTTLPQAPIPQPQAIDDGLVMAALEGIKAAYFAGGVGQARDPTVQTELTTGVGSTTWFQPGQASGGFGPLPPSCVEMLNLYKRVRM